MLLPACIRAAAARAHSMVPTSVVPITRAISSGLASATVPAGKPAALTSAVRFGPARLNARSTAAASATSHGTASATPPAARMSAATASNAAARRASSSTRRPGAASSRAVAAPTPLLAPVTTMVSISGMTRPRQLPLRPARHRRRMIIVGLPILDAHLVGDTPGLRQMPASARLNHSAAADIASRPATSARTRGNSSRPYWMASTSGSKPRIRKVVMPKS